MLKLLTLPRAYHLFYDHRLGIFLHKDPDPRIKCGEKQSFNVKVAQYLDPDPKEKSAEAGEKEGPEIITFYRHNWLLSHTEEKFCENAKTKTKCSLNRFDILIHRLFSNCQKNFTNMHKYHRYFE